MCPVKQFALTHVVIFVLCACNAADRLVCAMRAFFIRREDAPHNSRMTFVLRLAAKKSYKRFLCFVFAPKKKKNKKSRKARLQ
mgnify:CR=1 FL=1